jgi:rubredoxin
MSEQQLPWWTCSECRYTLQAQTPPETCPACNKKCQFIESTCYTPECGGPQNPDPQIIVGGQR